MVLLPTAAVSRLVPLEATTTALCLIFDQLDNARRFILNKAKMHRSYGVKAASKTIWEDTCMLFIGIDVAKSKHDCCILNENGETLSTFVIKNDKQGFDELIAKIARFSSSSDFSDARIGLESTGHYSINLQNYLLQKRLCVRIYNPLSVNLLRKAQSLRKTKTDKSDCMFLATLLFSDDSKSYSQPVLPICELRNPYP